MKPLNAIQVRLSDEEAAQVDAARAANRQTPLSRAAYGREALINESQRRLQAIEALETGNPPADAPRQPGNGRTSIASIARNATKRGRK